MRFRETSAAAIVGAAMVFLVVPPAWAAFPGANGRIVFDREDVEVFSILPNGTGELNLSDNAADDDAAAWSPDGTRIAFSSDRDGSPDIWLMDPDGGNLVQVTSGSDNDDHPAWSPDGTRLVFQREQNGDEDVWVVDVDGGGATNLTNNPDEGDEAPNWSPDGTRIAFASDGDIFTMNPDGSAQTNVSDVGPSDPGEEGNMFTSSMVRSGTSPAPTAAPIACSAGMASGTSIAGCCILGCRSTTPSACSSVAASVFRVVMIIPPSSHLVVAVGQPVCPPAPTECDSP
jgi:dipeptidyl aminopeptidase/acylaminoacyl peptidase